MHRISFFVSVIVILNNALTTGIKLCYYIRIRYIHYRYNGNGYRMEALFCPEAIPWITSN